MGWTTYYEPVEIDMVSHPLQLSHEAVLNFLPSVNQGPVFYAILEAARIVIMVWLKTLALSWLILINLPCLIPCPTHGQPRYLFPLPLCTKPSKHSSSYMQSTELRLLDTVCCTYLDQVLLLDSGSVVAHGMSHHQPAFSPQTSSLSLWHLQRNEVVQVRILLVEEVMGRE